MSCEHLTFAALRSALYESGFDTVGVAMPERSSAALKHELIALNFLALTYAILATEDFTFRYNILAPEDYTF